MKKKIDKGLVFFGVVSFLLLIIGSSLYYITRSSMCLIFLMFTPAISVIISKIVCKEKFKDLYIRPNFKGNVKWYVCSYFLTPFIAYIGAIIYFLIFKNEFDPLNSRYAIEAGTTSLNEYISSLLLVIPLAILVNPIMGIIQCFGEELAWRGYLLPKLSEKLSIQKAVLINGVIWGLWHSPIIAMGYNYGNEYPILGIVAMILFCVVIGIISSYLFYRTKSIWCSILFHASINGIDKWTPSSMFMSNEVNRFVGPDLLGIIGGIGFIIIAIILFGKLKKCKFSQNQ